MDYKKGYVYDLMDAGGPTDIREPYFKEAVDEMMRTRTLCAKAHGKSSAQVVLRWQIQAGNIAIPGSSNEKHIDEDAAIWDFSLTESEMKQIAAMEKDRRNSTY